MEVFREGNLRNYFKYRVQGDGPVPRVSNGTEQQTMGACSKLHEATLELTKSSSIKQRLARAFSSLSDIEPTDLPSVLREQHAAILAALQAVKPLPGETAVQATVRKMSADEADDLAARIVELFATVSAIINVTTTTRGEGGSVTALRERGDSRQQPVPLLYAAEA